MKNLVDKTILSIQVSPEGSVLKIFCEEGTLTYNAFGD
jgi:hypothetical protein